MSELANDRTQIDPSDTSANAAATVTVNEASEALSLQVGEVPGCAFLEKLPLEMRNEVYKYLLVNDILAKPHEVAAANRDEVFTVEAYNLFPAILLTCRQIWEEAIAILYGTNTFFFDCRSKKFSTPVMRQRELTGGFRFRRPEEYQQVTALKRVERFKIIISSRSDQGNGAPDAHFDLLCREVHLNPLKSLEIVIYLAPRHMTDADFPETALVTKPKYYPYTILAPLHVFRNVPRFKLDVGIGNDHLGEDLIPLPEGLENYYESLDLDRSQELLKLQVTGDHPARLAFRMYERLLQYASAFERNMNFRPDMENSDLLEQSSSPSHRTNPFVMKPSHPVEIGLWNTKIKSHGFYIMGLCEHRLNVLQYLEPQYQRIASAATATADYVKSLKRRGCLFDPQGIHRFCYVTRKGLADALLLLEDYAACFIRDVPYATRRNIKLVQPDFDHYYSTQTREIWLKWMRDFLSFWSKEEGPIPAISLGNFAYGFRAVMDDIDSQYLQIRRARNLLYEFDDFKSPLQMRYLKLDLGRCDEMIDWNVYEPEIGAENDPSGLNEYDAWYEKVAMASRCVG